MDVKEPRQTRFDLRFSLGGVPVRINPLFWASSAVLGLRYGADPEGGAGYFGFWMAAVLVSGILHGLAQALTGRLFGVRGRVVLYGLGEVTLGIAELPRLWQRLSVLVAGPLARFAIVAGVWGVTSAPFPDALRRWGTEIATGTDIVWKVNYFWAVLDLLPIWPLGGGRVVVDVGRALFGRAGPVCGLILSMLTCAVLAVGLVVGMIARSDFPSDPRYFLDQQRLSVLLLFAFVFWLRGFLALWPDPPPSPDISGSL